MTQTTPKADRSTSRRPPKARLGVDGYVRLLAYVRDNPSTIPALAQGFGIGRDTAYKLIGRLHHRGWVRVSEWQQRPRAKCLPIFSFGRGEDMPIPATTARGAKIGATVQVLKPTSLSPELVGLCCVLDELETERNLIELREATGLHRDTIGKLLAAMVAHRLAHIARRLPRDGNIGGEYVRYWRIGPGTNAKAPERSARARENQRRYRMARKQREAMTSIVQALAGAANQAQAEQAA